MRPSQPASAPSSARRIGVGRGEGGDAGHERRAPGERLAAQPQHRLLLVERERAALAERAEGHDAGAAGADERVHLLHQEVGVHGEVRLEGGRDRGDDALPLHGGKDSAFPAALLRPAVRGSFAASAHAPAPPRRRAASRRLGRLRARLPARVDARAAPRLRPLDRGLGGGARHLHRRPRRGLAPHRPAGRPPPAAPRALRPPRGGGGPLGRAHPVPPRRRARRLPGPRGQPGPRASSSRRSCASCSRPSSSSCRRC